MGDELRPFDYELPSTTKGIVDTWVVRLQAVAIVTALLAQIELSLIGALPAAADPPHASDVAVRFFGYSGLVLNLGATLSAVLLLLAVTSVPTAARRLYVSCSHGYPRKVFDHASESPDDTTPDAASPQNDSPSPFSKYAAIAPQFAPYPANSGAASRMNAIQSLNRFLLKGDTEGNVLYAFGVARGWGLLLRHCIFCFLGGIISAFVHVGVALWLSEATVVAAIMMPVVFVGFVPPVLVFIFGMDTTRCEHCAKTGANKEAHGLHDILVEKTPVE